MIENVVYILGAGFSAPLGLPVMSNFVFKSKDQYFAEPDKYAHFKPVIDEINRMSVAKNYYDADLFNIEEILSIMEMSEFTDATKRGERASFLKYLADVITYHTPVMIRSRTEQWWENAFGSIADWYNYGAFVAGLCHVDIGSWNAQGRMTCRVANGWTTNYSVITLNYDCVLETVIDFLRRTHETDDGVGFDVFPGHVGERNSSRTILAKLHGSASDPDSIVPPTWSKGRHDHIAPAWAVAHRALSEATRIRVLGYSLPLADSYVKYLLKSAATNAKNLKSIDVLCWDDDENSVQRRYKDFIPFAGFRFMRQRIENYLLAGRQSIRVVEGSATDVESTVERCHSAFFG